MKIKIRFVLAVFLLFSFIILVFCNKQKTEWKGTIEEENGILVVKNPKEPIYGEDVFNLEEEITSALHRFLLQMQNWKRWASRPLTEFTYSKVMDAMRLGKKATEVIESRVNLKAQDYDTEGFPVLTIWTFFNILTWYATHRAVSLNHRVEIERRIRAAIAHIK